MGAERCYETSLHNQVVGDFLDLESLLPVIAKQYGAAQRQLFKAIHYEGQNGGALKSSFCARFGLTSRQFNSIHIDLKGKLSSNKESTSNALKAMKGRVKSIRRWLKRTATKISKARDAAELRELKSQRHQKMRRLRRTEGIATELSERLKENRLKLCFGGRKLFHKQFHLLENDYESHAEWYADFSFRRNSQFFIVGSHDETCGNQSAQFDPLKGELKLRLSNSLAVRFGQKHVVIRDIHFKYGEAEILRHLAAKQAISFRFLCRQSKGEKRWHLQAMIDLERSAKSVPLVSNRTRGALGIDINADHLALTLIDRHGNYKNTWSIAWKTMGVPSRRTRELCYTAAGRAVAMAREHGVPIVVEDLDFRTKKDRLREESRFYARMLSQFAYAGMLEAIQAKAHAAGIEVIKKNPAMTSIIGRLKYQEGYGFSVHSAAALVIARRGLSFSERVSFHGTSSRVVQLRQAAKDIEPLWSQKEHPWGQWRVLSERLGTQAGRSSVRSRWRTYPRSPQGP
jgi:IS605 OrfB family transposase